MFYTSNARSYILDSSSLIPKICTNSQTVTNSSHEVAPLEHYWMILVFVLTFLHIMFIIL